MKDVIEEAIKKLVEKTKDAKPDDVMRYSQSALNLAHVYATLWGCQRP